MTKEDNSLFYQAIGNSIQMNKDKIEKLEKQMIRLKKKNKQLKEELKGYQQMYFDKVMIINKAIEYIEKEWYSKCTINIDDVVSFGDWHLDLLKILRGDSNE